MSVRPRDHADAVETLQLWLANDAPVNRRARVLLKEHQDPKRLAEWVANILYARTDTLYRELCRAMPDTHPYTRDKWEHIRDVAYQVPRWVLAAVPPQVLAEAVDRDNEFGWRERSEVV